MKPSDSEQRIAYYLFAMFQAGEINYDEAMAMARCCNSVIPTMEKLLMPWRSEAIGK